MIDDAKFIDAIPGIHSPKECFIINRYNKTRNEHYNYERGQMRKHSTTDDPWWKIW